MGDVVVGEKREERERVGWTGCSFNLKI